MLDKAQTIDADFDYSPEAEEVSDFFLARLVGDVLDLRFKKSAMKVPSKWSRLL